MIGKFNLKTLKPDLKEFCRMELFCNIVLKDNMRRLAQRTVAYNKLIKLN